jgi:hypothetical protein
VANTRTSPIALRAVPIAIVNLVDPLAVATTTAAARWRRRRLERLGSGLPRQHVALVNPGLHADQAERGVRLGLAEVDVGAQGV